MTDRSRDFEAAKVEDFALALNFVPVIYLAIGTLLLFQVDGLIFKIGVGVTWIFGVPLLLYRLIIFIWGEPQGKGLEQSSRAFKVWWVSTQIQMVFNRFPFFEEVIRLLPGVYVLWLRLWGSNVSAKSFWGPGSRVLDRGMVDVEDGAVIGMQAVLSPHLGRLDSKGNHVVDVARIRIGQSAIIGGRACIGPGCAIGRQEEFPAGRLLKPFTKWSGGRKVANE